ncbi:probable ubiquitin carboxyl-terminal hydrolase FAF-X [Oppia nitens]|uniref:probable ubiquitin carboxyl-terminal hydrolase FAF-X n=1 Tax=Oppia nitens TaxID=1686743 RepID=UPI0023D9B024|nr:probable ubiquitin carboxyl-terminal hydrolase FAF-X [Oppia nitens]XP_054167468.1 probable ubiquitin carboxyl-terminal hydrolase FAF-X [Oppia nitens]
MTVVMSTGNSGQQSQQSPQTHPNVAPQQQSADQTQTPPQPMDIECDESLAQASSTGTPSHVSDKSPANINTNKTNRKINYNKSVKTLADNNQVSDGNEEVLHFSSTSHHKSNESLNISDDIIEMSTDGDDSEAKQELADDEEPEFPVEELNKLDDMINKPRWVIPVLPKGELEILLETTIKLCRKGYDIRSEPCQRFIREGLTISFTKILTDEAVNGWKFEIHRCILNNCERLIELIVLKLNQDWFPLLDLLAMVFCPSNKFHSFTSTRTETITRSPDEEVFAKSQDLRTPKGWLIDLINKFGKLGGFKILLERFQSGPTLTVPLIAALLKPFGLSYELLTTQTIETYFLPIIKIVPQFLDNLTDDELKKEAKNETKNDALSGIVKSLKCLASRVTNDEEMIKNLEIFRLKTILRLLQISSFNGKMNALNEVNKVITSVSYYSHRHQSTTCMSGVEEEEWLTAEKMAEWLKENKVLQIVLRDSLHQPQYVEKLEKIIRFVLKEKALTLEDLDDIWSAQSGKHEAIVKNVHDLLAKLAWDFSPEQLDHLFECFQQSWTKATKKQREKLLELIRRLAEDDKDGLMANKVLNLLWNLAHSDDVPNDIMDQALGAHVKILDYSCSQDRDTQKTEWLDKCVEELTKPNGGVWVLPALKQIREVCSLYNEAPPNFVVSGPTISGNPSHHQRVTHLVYRHEIISRLQNQHSLVILVSENLSSYMNRVRMLFKEGKHIDPNYVYPGSRFSHVQEVLERLNFLRFLLKDGQLWLCSPQAKQIWKCLAENAVYLDDREACFRWFSLLMSDEPDLDPDINRNFFENNILQLDPSLVTESGIECFDRFFKAVNVKEGKLIAKRRCFQMEDNELIGIDYLWRVILCCSEDVARKAIELLKETYTNLGPKLMASQVELHEDFINTCFDRLRASYDTISIIEKDITSEARVKQEMVKMTRVLEALYEYINQCDNDFGEERTILPMSRSFRGKHLMLTIRFPNHGRHVDDIEIWTHTNDTLHSIRQQILNKIKVNNSNMKVDLYMNGDLLDPIDKKLVSQLPFKDKMVLNGKLFQVNSNMACSPDSSSDSSTGTGWTNPYSCANPEAEACLPGVIMSRQSQYTQFLFQLADIGMSLNNPSLRESALSVLKIMSADIQTIEHIKQLCMSGSDVSYEEQSLKFDSEFFNTSPTRVIYNMGIIYSLLIPASNPLSDGAQEFQMNFMKSGCGLKILELLTKNNFLSNADDFSKMCAFLIVLKISKLTLTTIANCVLSPMTGHSSHNVITLQDAIQSIPNVFSECMTRSVSQRIAQNLRVCDNNQIYNNILNYRPDKATITSVMLLSWSAATGRESSLNASTEQLHQIIVEPNDESPAEVDQVCKEAIEVLTVMFMLSPEVLVVFMKEQIWQTFVIDLLLICNKKCIRSTALEQLALIATKCATEQDFLVRFVQLLFIHLGSTVSKESHYESSQEFFQLFCRLLNYASQTKCLLPNVSELLNYEMEQLRNVRKNLVVDGLIEEIQLEGHLGITKEIISLLDFEQKYDVGCDMKGIWGQEGHGLINILIDEYIFPASRAIFQTNQQKNTNRTHIEEVNPICTSPSTLAAAYDCLVALSTGCAYNLQLTATTLIEMFYSTNETLVDWEYLPPIGPRSPRGFVGLKNAGATCYMNSVLQQLYMIQEVRDGILAIEGAATDPNEDFSGDDRNDSIHLSLLSIDQNRIEESNKDDSRKDYNLGVLKQIQAIFGHLILSKCQYYVPKGFWRHFKLWGEPVNLREQHDALEFFNSLVDSLDEALKSLGHLPIMSNVLGGTFADQKICKDCPHRYSREESFTTLNIDIRNHSNLLDSLEQYVKGDLLEGANAYHCEKCNRKVDTMKRLCIKKLPSVLAIQLKRFDYDWERECAIKFNDYFEFPRFLDMEPYTVRGLAKVDGQMIDDDLNVYEEDQSLSDKDKQCTKYDLCGIVVHSGQASGGHYYSYILYKSNNGSKNWFKFDDGDVSECKLDEDEEMRAQCFGGDYMGEVFDHMLKRMSCRRQKRWWNAYILFYRRNDTEETALAKRLNELVLMDSKANDKKLFKMPVAIERSVQRQNIKFMHMKNQFSYEYYQFMKKLISANGWIGNYTKESNKWQEELATISTQLASKFLFSTCLRTKKSLRGPALDWYEILTLHLKVSESIRMWFITKVLLAHQNRFSEYLLECPSADVRVAFSKIIIYLAHFTLMDGSQVDIQQSSHQNETSPINLSNCLIRLTLDLLRKEVSDYSRNLGQYFSLFSMYASIGKAEKLQLLKQCVPELFILVALDEGPGPPIKYQYADLGKLYNVVSLLIRCCDVSSKTISSMSGNKVYPNPFMAEDIDDYLMPIPPQVADLVFNKSNYTKKIIEEANSADDTIKLLKFCCWENPHFSSMVLSELLWQIAYSYAYELRPHLDLLLEMLLLDDSWQTHRLLNALRGGTTEEREALFDTINRNKSHYQKRAYQCIKCLVTLFSSCPLAHQLLHEHIDLKRKWMSAVVWLSDELDKRPYAANNQYGYNNWSPPAQSNETSNGYYLERSHSARLTLSRAHELCPPEEPQEDLEEHEISQETDSPPSETVSEDPLRPRSFRQRVNEDTNKYKLYECNDETTNKWWNQSSSGPTVGNTHPTAGPSSPTTSDVDVQNRVYPWINSNPQHNSPTKIKPMTSSPQMKNQTVSHMSQQSTSFDRESQTEDKNSQQNKNVFNES